jgi:hypothetical protein
MNAASEILKLEIQEKMPHLKEEYVDAAINNIRKDTASKTNKTEITIQNDIITPEPKTEIQGPDKNKPDGIKGAESDLEEKIRDFLKKPISSRGDAAVSTLMVDTVSPSLVAAVLPANKSGKIEL